MTDPCGCSKQPCGCCEGTERLTPAPNENRPGLSALSYRAGTHASFLETMLAGLTSHRLPPPSGDEEQLAGPRPLLSLRTRESEDASIAFLDAWATVADVLTFYQERIANEGYLRTATERRSVIELANLVGYRPRPGVSASAHLAYTLEDGAEVTIPAGSKAASTPAQGQLPQTFETAEELYARAEWNVLVPRLSRPLSPLRTLRARRPLYLKGTATNLKPNDPLLVDLGLGGDSVLLFRVTSIEPDFAAGRTKVNVRLWTEGAAPAPQPSTRTPTPALDALKATAARYRAAEEFGVNANTATAGRVLGHVDTLTKDIDKGISDEDLRGRLDAVLPPLREEHRLAREGGYTKLEPWIGGLVRELDEIYEGLPEPSATAAAGGPAVGSNASLSQPSGLPPAGSLTTYSQPSTPKSSLSNILPLLGALTKEPSSQPRSSRQLTKTHAAAFSSVSDNLPRLLGAFAPSLGQALYGAWGSVPLTPRAPAAVYALRTRASAFGHNAPLDLVQNNEGVVTGRREWTLFRSTVTSAQRRFRVNITYSGVTPAFTARVDVLNDSGGVTQTASLSLPIQDTSTPIAFPMSEHVRFTVSGANATNGVRATYTFTFTDFDAVVSITYDGRQDTVNVTSSGGCAAQVDYDPTTSTASETFFDSPSMTALCAVSVPGTGSEATETAHSISLDAVYNKILPGGWIVVERPPRPTRPTTTTTATTTATTATPPATTNTATAGAGTGTSTGAGGSGTNGTQTTNGLELIIRRVESVGEGSRADYGMTAKGTRVGIDPKRGGWIDPQGGDDFSVIRNTNVYVESELLELADEPIDPVREAVCGGSVELTGVVSGLEAGRWLIITGERADVVLDTADGGALPATSEATRARLLDAPRGSAEMSRAFEPGFTAAPLKPGGEGVTTRFAGAGQGGGAGEDDGGVKGVKKEVLPGVAASELVMLSGVEQSYDPQLPGDRTHTTLLFATPLAYCYKRDTVRIYGNVVRATHGETRSEVLGSGDAGAPMQTFALKQSPLTYVSAPTASGVESTLRVRVNEVLWHESDTLAGLSPLERRYVTKTDDAGVTSVVFGNGRHGARVPTGTENVRAVYRYGIGKGGNLKAGQINQPTTKPLGVKEVVNPLPATGGADREGRDEARRNAPLALMALDRLVSTRDYEDFARTFAGVAKASAARLSDGRRRVVHVTVAGADDAPISKTSDLYKNLREALHRYGDPFQPVEVETRYLKTLFVSANVRIHPDYLWESVEPKVRAALLERFGFDRRELGQDALLSEAVAAAQSVEGVVYVDFDTFDDVAEGVSLEELLGVGESLALRRRVRAYPAHVESAALAGAGSRIRPAQLALLTPLVPDTLILKEVKG